MWKTVLSILGAVVVLGTAVGGFVYLDDRHAHSKTLNSLKSATIISLKLAKDESAQTMQQIQTSIKQINQRITQNKTEDRINGITQQMWDIENRCGTRDVMRMNPADRERYRRLDAERTRLEVKLNKMTNDGDGQ